MAAMTWRQWIRTVEIVPALGSADPAAIELQVDALLRTGCRVFHVHADGDLDRALAIARLVGPALRRYDGVLEVQVDADPEPAVFAAVAEAGGSSVTFPLEAAGDVEAALASARGFGLQTGVAYSPETDPVEAAQRSAGADLVRCPGSSPFEQLRDVRFLARSLPEGTAIEVGGGITHESVRELYDAGARVLVVGTAIFEREDLPRAYRRLVQALA
jgi:ribulose-phosphate 3-epimerase